MVFNDLDVLKAQIRGEHVSMRIEGTDRTGRVVKWVTITGKPVSPTSWCFEIKMGDGTHYEQIVPSDGLEDAAIELVMKLKAAFADKPRHTVS